MLKLLHSPYSDLRNFQVIILVKKFRWGISYMKTLSICLLDYKQYIKIIRKRIKMKRLLYKLSRFLFFKKS